MYFDDLLKELVIFLEDKGLYVSTAVEDRIEKLIVLLQEDPYNIDVIEG